MKLAELAARVPGARVDVDPGAEVSGIAYDSRRVQSGDIFVAIKGANYDGARFVGEAHARGAVAVVAEGPLPLSPGLGLITAPSARRALGEMAASLQGDPSEHLRLTGVTGTDG